MSGEVNLLRDGGQHDGDAGCQGDLVCGSNNCLKFGSYFHPKDDCCENPDGSGGGFYFAKNAFQPFKWVKVKLLKDLKLF